MKKKSNRKPKRLLVGKLDVDSGLLYISDPIYNEGYDVSYLEKEVVLEHSVAEVDHDSGFSGKGIIVGDLGQDKTLPVYVERNSKGTIKRIIIEC